MKLTKKKYIKKGKNTKILFEKQQIKIKNGSNDSSFVLFLQPFKSKNQMISITSKISLLKGEEPTLKLLTLRKKTFLQIKRISITNIETSPKTFFLAIKLAPNSEINISNFEVEILSSRKEQMLEKFKSKNLLLVPAYPDDENKYNCAFLHSRYKAYLEQELECDLIVANHKEDMDYTYEYDGIKVHCLSYNDVRELFQTHKYQKIFIHFFSLSFAQILDGSDMTETQIFINSHGADTLYWDRPLFASKYFTTNYVFSENETKELSEMDKTIKRYNEMNNVKFVFVSPFTKKRSEELIGVKYKNYEIIPCIVDEKNFKYKPKDPEQRKKICMIRSFHNLNSYSIDINVLTILELSKKPIFNDLEFSIYGYGEMHELLLKPIKHFKNVKIYPTFLKSNQMSEMFENHGISLFATRYDNQAVASLESAMMGTIPITSYGTGVSDFLNEKNGNFCKKDDYKEMALLVENLYNDEKKFLKMSKAVHESVMKTASTKVTIDKEITMIKKFHENLNLHPQKRLSKNPLLSIAIPAYNCEKFLVNTIYSLINHKYNHFLEIIIINDGSKDNTIKVARKLENLSPSIKVIDKENGGHGSAINAGLKASTGKYFRLLDGDDYFITENFVEYLIKLKSETSDIVLTNYIEDFSKDGYKNVPLIYDNLIPYLQYDLDVMTYEGYGFKTFGPLLSTATYKTKNLKSAGFLIDENCFYVDMEYNFMGYIVSNNIVYYPITIYNYYLGRAGQSMDPASLKRNHLHHEKVTLRMVQEYTTRKNIGQFHKQYLKTLIIKMVVMQYELSINNFNSNRNFVTFDNILKKYPEFYNDTIVNSKKIKLFRLMKGNLGFIFTKTILKILRKI